MALRVSATALPILMLAVALGSSTPSWIDIAAPAGLGAFRGTQGSANKDYIVESIGGGCALFDYNGDGKLDILLVRGSTLQRLRTGGDPVVALFENRGNQKFSDVSLKAGLTARGWGMGVAVADYDNDGLSDFLVTGFGRNFLFHNQGTGGFREVGEAAGIARPGVWSSGASFGDIDSDGLLDLYIASYVDVGAGHLPRRGGGPNCLYKGLDVFCGPRGMKPGRGALFRNEGAGKFQDITTTSGVSSSAPPFFGLQPLIADFDGDGLADVFVANDSTPNYLYRNLGNNRFDEVAIAAGIATNMDGRSQASMGADLGDADGDGRLDLIVTNFSEDTNTLYRNQGEGIYEDVTWASKIGPPSWLFLGWGVKFFDYDNDGRADLIIGNGHVYPEADRFSGGSVYQQRVLLHHNEGKNEYSEVAGHDLTLKAPGTSRGLAVGDIDDDGHVDVLINQQDSLPRLLRNRMAGGHWLKIALRGIRSNRDGVGAMITLRAGGRTIKAVRLAGDSYLSSSDPRLHFGLGSAMKADRVEVDWPSGLSQTLTDVAADQVLTVEEARTGR